MLINRTPRSCIRNQSQENLLKRTKIVLALPSYHRQRLSGIRRGWCPSCSPKITRGAERVIRSDSGDTHRLSLSARVLSAVDSQVKAKHEAGSTSATSENRHPRHRKEKAQSNALAKSEVIIHRALGSAPSPRPRRGAQMPASQRTGSDWRPTNAKYYPGNIRGASAIEARRCPVAWTASPMAGFGAGAASS